MQENINSINNLLPSLKNPQLIEDLSKFVHDKISGTISIAYRKDRSQNQLNKIYFLIDSNKKLNLFDLSELTVGIKERLGYDYTISEDDEIDSIFVEARSLYDEEKINQLFSDITPLTKENFSNIELFLNKYYSHILGLIQKEKSMLTNFPGLLWQNTLDKAEAKDLDIELIEYLKSNSKLWHRLTRAPESWDHAQQEIKKEIMKASADNNPLVNF